MLQKVVLGIVDIFLWALTAGFGCCGVLFAAGALSYFRKHGRNYTETHDYKWIALLCGFISILSFVIFVAFASWAISVMKSTGG